MGLDIRVFNKPQFSREAVRVDYRGMIRMPFIEGEIRAACRTESELAIEITTLLLEYARHPQVDVFVKEYQSQTVAVLGAVRAPSRFQLQRRVRLLELLSFVNGHAENAGRTIQIVHTSTSPVCESPDPSPADELAAVDYYRLNETLRGDEKANPYVRAGDIISIPEADQVYVVGNVEQLGVKVMPKGSGYAVKILGGNGATRTLLALTDAQIQHPAGVAANDTSNLTSADNRADFVILTHRNFRDAVIPLANLRASQGMEVLVVNVEDVYDEFSYGAPSRQAIKDFFAFATSNWTKGPGYALLVGDASFDARNYLRTTHQDFVPTKLVDTNLLETASDDALVDFNNDSIADISIGRLPVQTPEQAQKMIQRITGYVPGQSGVGVLLVADQYDGYDFEIANERVRALLPIGTPVATVNRAGRQTEQVRGEIILGINQGPMIVNYSRHGSVEVWTGSGILRSVDAPALTNGQKAPLFVAMTCLNGFFHDVYTESLAEALMKADIGGSVAVWASSGLTEPEGQSLMDQQLMRLLFADGQAPMLGDAVRGAKAATTDLDVRRTWILFGDPTMRLR